MRILALETSGRVGSVALLEADGATATVLDERPLPASERSARTLLPCVHATLAQRGWRPADLAMICTTTGPGSFTGLRIGVVAAKTLAYALGAKLVGVHTLAAMAENVTQTSPIESGSRLWTILDAQRQELFAASFDTARPIVDQAAPVTEIVAIEAWLAKLQPGDVVAGPALTKLRSRLPPGVAAVDESLWAPSAAATGRLAVQLLARGEATPALELVPHYYRRSAAEEKHGAARSAPQTPRRG